MCIGKVQHRIAESLKILVCVGNDNYVSSLICKVERFPLAKLALQVIGVEMFENLH